MSASRNLPGVVRGIVGDTDVVTVKFTGAADVQADGYTINQGSKFVSAVTRTAEGIIKIQLRDAYAALLGLAIEDSKMTQVAKYTATNTSFGAATASSLGINCKVSGSDTDPDSAVFFVTMICAKSSNNVA